jgi:hypothetical protein
MNYGDPKFTMEENAAVKKDKEILYVLIWNNCQNILG